MRQGNKRPRERDIYIWNIAGSLANALFSVVILMLVTRSLEENQTDIFSIAWSISQLMIIIGTFQIRTYQATDIKGKYSFKQYLLFRVLTIVLMLVSSLLYVWFKGYDLYKSGIVFIMCVIRAIEALSDVYEGWFQQKERLDLAGKVITYRVIISTVVFGASLVITGNLFVSCILLTLCYLGTFLLYNIRYSAQVPEMCLDQKGSRQCKWISNIFIEGLPIFINAFLTMSTMNAPKMAIDTAIETGAMGGGVQTAFNILFMPASFINLAYIVFRPMITKMAIAWNQGKEKVLISILIKIETCLLGVGVVILVGAALLGIPILSIFYGVDLSDYNTHLLVVIIGGCFYTFSSVFDNALVAMRKQNILVISYIITWVYIQIVANKMVQYWGIMGASMAYATAMLVFLLFTMIIFLVCFKRITKEE